MLYVYVDVVHIGWGGPSTGPTLFVCSSGVSVLVGGVSRCGPAAVVGRGCVKQCYS